MAAIRSSSILVRLLSTVNETKETIPSPMRHRSTTVCVITERKVFEQRRTAYTNVTVKVFNDAIIDSFQ